MLRIRFVLPLLSVLTLGGCGEDDERCAEQASRFELVRDHCVIVQRCNGGNVLVHACLPAPGFEGGYTLYVHEESNERLGFATAEEQCLPDSLFNCEGPEQP
jgi:hypothetical protein